MTQTTVIPFDRSENAPLPLVAPDQRVYAIGDIHGRFDLLIKLLARITDDADACADERQVRLVFLGDYIDRGEQSRDVLTLLTRMAGFASENIVFLRGNHEDALRYFLYAPTEGADWFEFGGLQTLASFGIRPPRARFGQHELYRVRNELMAAISEFEPFLTSLVNTHRSGDVLFTHAGVEPGKPIEHQSTRALLWGHSDAKVADPLPGLRVVHGHFDDTAPTSLPGRICVDTGAYHTGCLTAVRLDESEAFLSVEA